MLRRFLAAAFCLVLLSACGETSFLGSRYDDFTAYYNTFYNAGKAFERGVTALQPADQPVDWDRYLAVYPAPSRTGSQKEFEDAIKKSADIIRSHPNSKWVDDAVLLIGKSYFYQQNYVAAAQKFREVVALETKLQDEGRFWLGRTLAANGSLTEARDHLEESLQRESLNARWEPALWLALGDLRVRMQDWDGAAEALRRGAEEIRDGEVAARAWFQLGQVEEMRGDAAAAAAAFAVVPRLQPPYELDFAGRLSGMRTAAATDGLEAALDGLRRLERDDKHRAKRAEILFIRGLVLQEEGYPQDALETYDALMYDSDVDVSGVRGRAHYQLGRLYRDDLTDFVLAAAHFDTAATVIKAPQGSMTEPMTTLAVADSRYQANIYNTYARVYNDIARMDSLLYLADLPQDEFDAFVHELRLKLAADMEAQRREEERQRDMEGFTDPVPGEQPQDGEASAGATASTSGGFLFHREPVRVQEGRQAFIRRWGDRPLVPGWRRREAIDAYASGSQDQPIAERPTVLRPDAAAVDAALPVVDVSAVPRSPSMREAMLEERALARYELGNVLFLSMDLPDSAAAMYQMVIAENQDLPVASRAYYALAEVNRALGQLDEADSLYRLVLQEFPGSELDRRVREQLGLDVDAVVDAAAVVREEYENALRTWSSGDHERAFSEMLEVGIRHPEDAIVPAALMAAARIGLEWMIRDSLSLFDPLPTSLSDSLLVAGGLSAAAESGDSVHATVQTDFVSPMAQIDSVSAIVKADSVMVQTDSVSATVKIGVAVGPDLAASDQSHVWIGDILNNLSQQFAGDPLAEQAQLLLSELESRRPTPESPSDTLLASAGEGDVAFVTDLIESSDGDGAVAADSTASEGEGLMAATPYVNDADAAPEESATPVEAFSLRGEGGLDLEAGGWTLKLAELRNREEAEAALAELKAEGYRAEIVERFTDEGTVFIMCAGQFAHRRMAEVAARTARGGLLEGATAVEVPALTASP